MSGLDNLRGRLNYHGGAKQQDRMIDDKRRTLKSALLYSYQAGTMIIENSDYDTEYTEGINSLEELEFRCLMNPDKLNKDNDLKMLSFLYQDICLNLPKDLEHPKTSEGAVTNPCEVGDTFVWKETGARWIVLWQYLDEIAYFRADTRKCFPYPIIINETEYWFAVVGPNQVITDWDRHSRHIFNTLNYDKAIYIKRNDETLNYFKRHKKVKFPDIQGELKPWTVVAVQPDVIDNVLILTLKEGYTDQTEEVAEAVAFDKEYKDAVAGNKVVSVYDEFELEAEYVEGAYWEVKNQVGNTKIGIDAIIADEATRATITLLNGQTGEFDIYYNNVLVEHIVVKSL